MEETTWREKLAVRLSIWLIRMAGGDINTAYGVVNCWPKEEGDE